MTFLFQSFFLCKMLLNLKCFRRSALRGWRSKQKCLLQALTWKKKKHTNPHYSIKIFFPTLCKEKQVLYKNSSVTLRSADLRCFHCVCSNVTKVIVWKWQMLYPENTISIHELCLQVMNCYLFALLIAVVWEERYALMPALGVIKLLPCFAFVIYWNDEDNNSP